MPRWTWYAIVGVCAVAALTYAARNAILSVMTRSTTASKKGIKNTPDTPQERKRLLWLDERRAEVEAVLRERWPGMRMTSAYRNDAVNKAVDGSPTSRHRLGLAIDFGMGIPDYSEHARYLKDHRARLKVQPRTVIAEVTEPHLHIDYNDPLGIVDKPGAVVATAWRKELPGRAVGQARNLVELA